MRYTDTLRVGRPLGHRLIEKVVYEDRGHSTTCWIWTATKNRKGYGSFGVDGRNLLAHRVAYELFVAPIPEGLTLDHLCRVPACINPEHLEPVTMQENFRRGIHANRSKTSCPKGHVYDLVTKSGARRCRTCLREQQRAYKQRIRDERVAA